MISVSVEKVQTHQKLLITAHDAFLVNDWDCSLIRHANFNQADDVEKRVLCKPILAKPT